MKRFYSAVSAGRVIGVSGSNFRKISQRLGVQPLEFRRVFMWTQAMVDIVKKHREAILAGAGIALFETLIKALLPGMGWLIDAPAAQSQLDNSDSEGGSVDFEGGEAITGTNADGTKYGPDGRPLADDGDDAQWGPGIFDLN